MSATVDTSNLRETLGVEVIINADKQRYPIWIHNLGVNAEESIVYLVEQTLLNPNPNSEYFPKEDYASYSQVMNDVLGRDIRARGMLVIVNSFSGENSDISQLAKLVEEAHFNQPYRQVEVLRLASEVIRNPERNRQFQNHISDIERRNGLYVIFATSVVEMGVTFPTLDYVVTMDSGYENVTISESLLPRLIPLGVNSLKQRFGRVGRRRAGIAYVTREVGAYYTTQKDHEINDGGLVFEPIGLPLLNSSLTQLAMFSFEQQWEDVENELRMLDLPSKIHNMAHRIEELENQRQRLINLGLANGNSLTPLGVTCSKWVGMADLSYATKLQLALQDPQPDIEQVLFWLVATALSATPISAVLEKQGRFAPRDDELSSELPEPLFELDTRSELVALYQIVSYFAKRFSYALWETSTKIEREAAELSYDIACASMGFDPKKLTDIMKVVTTALKTTVDTNRKEEGFKYLFGNARTVNLSEINWIELSDETKDAVNSDLQSLSGRHEIRFEDGKFGLAWIDDEESREGDFRENETPVVVDTNSICTGKLVPQLVQEEEGESDIRWKPIHVLRK